MNKLYSIILTLALCIPICSVSEAQEADAVDKPAKTLDVGRVIRLDSASAEMNIETKEAVGKVNLIVAETLNVAVATDETLTLNVSVTDLLNVGQDNINVYLERVHDLNGNLFKDADNLLGLTVKF